MSTFITDGEQQILDELFELEQLISASFKTELPESDNNRLRYLLNKYPGCQQFFEDLKNTQLTASRLDLFSELDAGKNPARAKLLDQIFPVKRINWFSRIAVAAAILLLLSIGTWYFITAQRKDQNSSPEIVQQPIDPGQYKAKLVLDDGSVIVLDKAGQGALTRQGETTVINKDGQLIYKSEGNRNNAMMNTLSTSVGESYATVLSDGSRVWLNSASSLLYPVSFSGDRVVEVTGEAYFEVTHTPRPPEGGGEKQPFIVKIKAANGKEMGTVKVLGTHFNIMAYGDEGAIKTTLLEGSVQVKSEKANVKLVPGEQAQLLSTSENPEAGNNNSSNSGSIRVIRDINLEKIIAWKNQDFYFKNDDLKTVMRQLARWYDVKVKYEGDLPEGTFSGLISRNKKLQDVLMLLKAQEDIDVTVNERTIVIKSTK